MDLYTQNETIEIYNEERQRELGELMLMGHSEGKKEKKTANNLINELV